MFVEQILALLGSSKDYNRLYLIFFVTDSKDIVKKWILQFFLDLISFAKRTYIASKVLSNQEAKGPRARMSILHLEGHLLIITPTTLPNQNLSNPEQTSVRN